MSIRSVYLDCQTNKHDKVYDIEIVRVSGLVDAYLVNFSYGRRGATPQTGSKTKEPVTLREANEIVDDLISEKKAKGYTEATVRFTGNRAMDVNDMDEMMSETETLPAPVTRRPSGILPQLLNPVDEDEIERLINSPDYCGQEKLDGRNFTFRKLDNGAITTINKKGFIVATPCAWMADSLRTTTAFTLPGEGIGDTLYAHDLLRLGTTNWRQMGYKDRYIRLKAFLWELKPQNIKLVFTAWTPAEKRALYEKLKAENREGMVFKRIDAPFSEGRPNSGGDQLKVKFYATLSALVKRRNARRSVTLELENQDGQLVEIGKVTIPPNKEIPEPGDVVEVRYLYAYHNTNCLYQTIYLGKRDDVDADECTFELQRVKYKPEYETE
jgi:bifunctional non-homologous end joining protein LigD